jgi:hypothetical protein
MQQLDHNLPENGVSGNLLPPDTSGSGSYRKCDFTGASVEVRCTLHLFRFSARVGLRFKDFEFKLKAIESGFGLAVEEEAMA